MKDAIVVHLFMHLGYQFTKYEIKTNGKCVSLFSEYEYCLELICLFIVLYNMVLYVSVSFFEFMRILVELSFCGKNFAL